MPRRERILAESFHQIGIQPLHTAPQDEQQLQRRGQFLWQIVQIITAFYRGLYP